MKGIALACDRTMGYDTMHHIRHVRDSLSSLGQSFRERIHPLSDPDDEVDVSEETLDPTPIYIGQRTRFVLLAAIVIGIIWFAREAPSIPRLLLFGATLALVLSFPVRLLSAFLPRGLSILIVVSSTVGIAAGSLILLVPFATSEIGRFIVSMPDIADAMRDILRDILADFQRRGWMQQNPDRVIDEIQTSLLDRGELIVRTLLANLVEMLGRTLGLALTTFGVVFVATYLLIDIPRFRERFVHAFSPAYREDADALWFTIGDSLSRYLAGLLISIVIQSVMVVVGLWIIGIPYALVLGLWMAVTAILPYVGAFLGAIPSILIALTISWQTAALVTLLYIVVNQVEGNLITPRIQGEAVRVHPLMILIAIVGGSEIAGPVGAVLAVPALAVLRVLAEFLSTRLRTRQVQDSVFTALGGADDGDAVSAQVERSDGDDITVKVGQDGAGPSPKASGLTEQREIMVHVATSRRVPITRPRRRPRIRRRQMVPQ